jgi:hypothetical protein
MLQLGRLTIACIAAMVAIRGWRQLKASADREGEAPAELNADSEMRFAFSNQAGMHWFGRSLTLPF